MAQPPSSGDWFMDEWARTQVGLVRAILGVDMVVQHRLWRMYSFVCFQDDVNLRLLAIIYERYITEWV